MPLAFVLTSTFPTVQIHPSYPALLPLLDQIPEDLIQWDNLKEQMEGNTFEFSMSNQKKGVIEVHFNGESIEIGLGKEYSNVNLEDYSRVTIHNVNPLTKSINYSLTT